MVTERVLKARIDRTPDGLYRAQFADASAADGASPETIPDVQLGTSEADVRVRVEAVAKGMGYARVAWETDGGAAFVH